MSAARRRWRRAVAVAARTAALALLGAVLLGLSARLSGAGPDDPQAALLRRYGSTVVVDRHGQPLRELTGPGHTRTDSVALQAFSPLLVQATLFAEDRRFWQHPGVDPLAIARAALSNLRRGRVFSGASTLTQQVVRVMQPRPRTLPTKLREAWLALALEGKASKAEILNWYLNFAPYGSLVRGAERASRVYFGKPASDLTLAEAALLAVLPRSPSRRDLRRHLERARRAQTALLQQMAAAGEIDADALARALAQPIAVQRHVPPFEAPHLAEMMRESGPDGLDPPAARVVTALDAGLQSRVQGLVRSHLDRLAGRGVGNAAVVVIDVAQAEVRVLVGSREWDDLEHLGANNGALALRQPGSTLKAFTYALAFDDGGTAADVLADTEGHFSTDKGDYSPENYRRVFRGPVRARVALASSMNLPAVRLAARVGPARLQDRLQALGLEDVDADPQRYGLGLTLGNAEVTLLQLTDAFAALARGGVHRPARVFRQIVRLTETLSAPEAPARRVFSPEAAWLVGDILADPDARAPSFGRGGPLELPFFAASKTGTSKGFRDNWAMGFTPRYAVGVWVGHFDGRPMRDVSGVTGAGPLYHDVMLLLHGDQPPRRPAAPQGMRVVQVCALSGQIPGPHCPHRIDEHFAPGRAPAQACTMHVALRLDRRNRRLATASCPPGEVVEQVFVALPPELRLWGQRVGQPAPPTQVSGLCAPPETRPGAAEAADPASAAADAPLPAPAAAHTAAGAGRPVRITSPHPGAVFYRDSTLPEEEQRVALRAVTADPGARLLWFVDGQPVAPEVAADAPVWWTVSVGTHRLEVRLVGPAGKDALDVRVLGAR